MGDRRDKDRLFPVRIKGLVVDICDHEERR